MNSSTEASRPEAAAAGGLRKFSFETVFSHEGEIVRDGQGFRTQFSVEEMAGARAEAYAAGQRDSEEAARMALSALTASMTSLHTRLDAECRALREEAAELAMAMARKVCDAALEAYGRDTIAAMLTQVVGNLRGAPRLVIRVAPSLAPAIQSRLEDLKREIFHEGALLVRADPAVAAGDVTIEWAEGAIRQDRNAAFAAMEETISRTLAAAAEEAA